MAAALALVAATAGAAGEREAQRLDDARVVFGEMRGMPDQRIPNQLLERARCIVIFPAMIKGALGWGGRLGHGVMSCRDTAGRWGPPSFLTLTGGSFGFQAGVEKADVVLFFMTEAGARSLMESEYTLGGKGSVVAGPVGRTAEASTDVRLDAEIYSYSRAKGLFAGLSLEGARVSSDRKAIRTFYGEAVEPRDILFAQKVPVIPPAAQKFMQALP
jgi:lipid-binding SYLF domain-containing protein